MEHVTIDDPPRMNLLGLLSARTSGGRARPAPDLWKDTRATVPPSVWV